MAASSRMRRSEDRRRATPLNAGRLPHRLWAGCFALSGIERGSVQPSSRNGVDLQQKNWPLMRILHVFDHSLPLQSGYVTRSLGIIGGQRSRGWQTVHVTTPRHGATGAASETVDGFKFYRTAGSKVTIPIWREILEMRATARRLTEIVATEKPDLIHAHSPVLNVLPAVFVARKFNIPVVYEVRALWEDAAVDHGTTREGALRYRLSRLIDTWVMRRVDCVIAICEPL